MSLGALACLALACSAAPGGEVGVDAGAAASSGPRCGDVRCEEGQRCCGCGLCAAPGQACPPVGCDDGGGLGGDGGLPRAFCLSNAECGPDERGGPEDGRCGGAGTGRPRPATCEEGCPGVCGCDGVHYCNACVAEQAGQAVDAEARCEPASCAPADAAGEGLCGAFFGYAWDGDACAAVNGCRCVGADCEATFDEPTACEAAHRSCAGSD